MFTDQRHTFRFLAMISLLVMTLTSITVWSMQKARSTGSVGLAYDWLEFNGDSQHSGNNVAETTITTANVASLRPVAGFPITVPSPADGAPVYLHNASTANGMKDLLFVTTKAGDLIAYDAHSGAQIWSRQHPAGSCKINGGSSICYTTSSPAIDPNRRFVYTYGLDGYVHKHQVANGIESIGGGWPALATRKPYTEKGSSALTIATAKNGTSYLYVTNGGYPGDAGNYQGHVTTINLVDGTQHVFNAACSNQIDIHFVEPPASHSCTTVQTAIWSRAGVVYDPDKDTLYTATGNGDYAPANHNWGDSVLALHPDGTSDNGPPLDSYTPTNYRDLQNGDTDLGSTAPALLPAPVGSTVPHLGLQGGKDQNLRLLNLDNLSGQGAPGHTGGEIGPIIPIPQSGELLTTPAVWHNPADGSIWSFVANSNGISALQLTLDGTSTPNLVVKWQKSLSGSQSSPLIANNVLYIAHNNLLEARDAASGNVLWSSASIGAIHWSSPVVVNGVLYLSDSDDHLFAFAINGVPPVFHDAYLPRISH